jgi:hypothetical protein
MVKVTQCSPTGAVFRVASYGTVVALILLLEVSMSAPSISGSGSGSGSGCGSGSGSGTAASMDLVAGGLNHKYILSSSNCDAVAVLNDNYCDCGNDENLTSACSMYTATEYTFQCAYDLPVPQKVYMSRVSE